DRSDGAHDLDIFGRFTDASDERTINPQRAHRAPVQTAARTITDASVDDSHVHAERFQPPQQLHGGLDVFHYRALGDLKFQIFRVDASLFQNLADFAYQLGPRNLLARKVHAHEQRPIRGGLPLPLA